MILSLDIGTSSSRALLYDTDAATMVPNATHSISHEPDHTPDGGATLDPEKLLQEAIDCARAVLPLAKGQKIDAVGISTFWHSFSGIDNAGKATTPILLWADTRSSPQVAELRKEMDVDAYSQRTGCPLHTSYPPGRLRWLAETDKAAFDASARFVSPGEYFVSRLFGPQRVTCSTSMASATGLWSQANQEWDAETLRHLPGMSAERLSRVSDEPVIGLTAEFRERLPELAAVPWFPALGDGACSNVGCGAVTPGKIALMIGTSGALRAPSLGDTPPPLPPGLWRYQIGPGRFLVGGALTNGGSVWAWAKRTLQLPDAEDAKVEEALAALAPDSHGLTVLPFLSGERAPLWRDDLKATIHGLTVATTPLQIVRAHLEAVALRFAAVREALRPVAAQGTMIGTGAGLIASPVWAQILTDALGEPLAISSEEQASSRGAMLWAREKIGKGSLDAAPPVPVTRTVEPNETATKIYRAARERQEALLQKLL